MNYNGVKEVSYRYNKTGDLVSMTDWLGTSAFELDLLHQLTAAADHKGNRVEVHLRRRGQPDRPNVLNQNPILSNGKITTDANFNITGKAANGRETFEIILIEIPIYQYMLNEYSVEIGGSVPFNIFGLTVNLGLDHSFSVETEGGVSGNIVTASMGISPTLVYEGHFQHSITKVTNDKNEVIIKGALAVLGIINNGPVSISSPVQSILSI